MKTLLPVSLFLALFCLPAFAEYDSSWYSTPGWSGEYPTGFSVTSANVSLTARTDRDLALSPTVACGLPKNAVYHPWNQLREATYHTMSKIVLLTVKEDFEFVDGEARLPLKKGDTIEYLVYGSEGYFLVRIQGVEYVADQSLFEQVEPVDAAAFHQDEWVQVNCASGEQGWLLMADLLHTDAEGNEVYEKGLDSWFLGFVEYGVVRDIAGN